MQVGEQAINVARNAVLAAGGRRPFPARRSIGECGSSQQAAHFAAQGVLAGAYDVVVAGGVEVMTRVPMGSSMADGKFGWPFGPAVGLATPTRAAWSPGHLRRARRRQVESRRTTSMSSGGASQQLAGVATAEGRFEREITPVLGADGAMVARDEGLRDTTVESLGKLKPSFRTEEEGGRVTAGNSSQITDRASAVLIMSEEKAAELGVTPRARFVGFAVAGADPRLMLTAPIPATQKVLDPRRSGDRRHRPDRDQRGVRLVVLAWQQEIKAETDTINVNGGAIALGHPLGRLGAAIAGHAGVRAGALRRPLRPADDVRRRRPGQRHHH